MALPDPKDLEHIKKLIEEIKASGGDIPTGLEVVNIKSAEDAIRATRILNREVRDMNDTFASIQQRIQSQGAELTKSLNPLNLARSSYKSISTETEKILRDHHGITDLNQKQLNQIKQKVTGEIDNMNRQAKRLKEEKIGSRILDEYQIKRLLKNKKITQQEAALLRGYVEGNHFLKDQIDFIDKRIAKEKDYTEVLGIAGNSAKALDGFLKRMGLGNVSEFLEIDEALASSKEHAKGLSSILDQNKAIETKSKELAVAKEKAGKKHLSAAQLRRGFGGKELMEKQKILDADKKHVNALGKSLGLNKKAVGSLTKMGAKTRVLGVLGKNLFKNLAKKLHDPMTYIKAILNAVKQLDALTGKMAKDMDMSVDASRRMARHLQMSANFTASTFVTGKGLAETNMELNSALGMQVEMNHENLAILTKIGKIAGYSAEQKQEINKLGAVSGQQADDFLKSGLGTVKAMTSQKGLALNTKKLFQDMLKASNSIKASLGGNADKLAEAVVEAKALGTTLQVVEGIVSNLIDIEGSFKKELEAELLIGRDLNLERARSLALAGEYAGVAKEINREVGSLAEFEKMNVIQQQKLAEAVGMTRDQLSGALMEQEAMTKLSGVEGKNAKEKFDNLVKEVGMAEAKKRLGNDELANQMAQANLQERMAAAMEKLMEVFLSIADALTPIFSMLMTIGEVVIPIINMALAPIHLLFQGIAEAIQLTTDLLTGQAEGPLAVILGIMSSIALTVVAINIAKRMGLTLDAMKEAWAKRHLIWTKTQAAWDFAKSIPNIVGGFVKWLGPLGLALGAAAVVGVASMMASAKTGNDVFSPATGGGGYGSRVLFGPEGAISFNNKDTIVAGTDLFQKGNDVISPPVQKADDMALLGKGDINLGGKQTVENNVNITMSDPYQMGFALDKTESVIA